jgi:hypothetical protein
MGLSLNASGEENLLKNGSIDRDLSSWKPLNDEPARRLSPGVLKRSMLDASDSATSGSLELRLEVSKAPSEFEVGQCTALTGSPKWVIFGGRMRVPSRQQDAGTATLYVEFYRSEGCKPPQMGESGGIPIGLANSDRWARRIDVRSVPPGATAIRLVARIRKEGAIDPDASAGGQRFVAFFDDLFVAPAATPGVLPDLPQAHRGCFSGERVTGSPQFRWYGERVFGPPVLTMQAFGKGGEPIASRELVTITTSDRLNLYLALAPPPEVLDRNSLPLPGLWLPGFSQPKGIASPRQSVELLAYRSGDANRTPLYLETDTGAGGTTLFLSVRLAIDRESRIKSLRALLECAKARGILFGPPLDGTDVGEEALLAPPFAADAVDHPIGDFEIVACYEALDAGYWHDPVLSVPLKIRVTPGKSPCTVSR